MKLKYDGPPSSFGFIFILRHYIAVNGGRGGGSGSLRSHFCGGGTGGGNVGDVDGTLRGGLDSELGRCGSICGLVDDGLPPGSGRVSRGKDSGVSILSGVVGKLSSGVVAVRWLWAFTWRRGDSFRHTSKAKWPAGPIATDLSAGSTGYTRFRARGGAGAGRGSAVRIPFRVGNGGTGDPLASGIRLGSACSLLMSTYNL